jgi:mycofactocin biosynthesis protein MftB
VRRLLSVNGNRSFDSSVAYRLDDNVALRAEPFGALAYHYDSRRLTFLRSKLLAHLVADLGDHPSVDAALDSEVPVEERAAYLRALESLYESRFIRVV